jgi:uncharacterized protein YcnI
VRLVRGFAVTAIVVGFIALGALPASAHVAIDPESAPRGSEAVTLAFNVPNEKDPQTTTQVELVMPENHPFTLVDYEPAPGWKVTTQTTTLPKPVQTDEGLVKQAVTRVIFSGGSIDVGQFQRFVLRVGPLPDTGSELEFKALQTYSDGTVVRWIETTPPGGPEPDNPAPVLKLTAATGEGGSTSGATAGNVTIKESSDSKGVAIAALAVGGVALVVGVVAIVMGRRRSST